MHIIFIEIEETENTLKVLINLEMNSRTVYNKQVKIQR